MPGKLIIKGIEYTNTNPTTVIKQGEGLSHIIEREFILFMILRTLNRFG